MLTFAFIDVDPCVVNVNPLNVIIEADKSELVFSFHIHLICHLLGTTNSLITILLTGLRNN